MTRNFEHYLKIILISNSFPYLPGEQFLETEVKYYLEHKDVELTIMPLNSHNEKREIDKSIKLDTYLIDNKIKSKLKKIFLFFKSIFSRLFFDEIVKNKVNSFSKFRHFTSAISNYQYYYDLFDNYFQNKKDLSTTVVYTYWNDTFTYALQSLKRKYGYKVVSRIHGYDIYKERRIGNYMPLKIHFTENIDKIYTISESAIEYLHKVYGFKKDILQLLRLGVNDYGIISKPNKSNLFHIVSCSFLTPVKRVDKIINALSVLSEQLTNIKLIWTHIGSGPLEKTLKDLANEMLSQKENVNFNFVGHLDNQDVYKFYKKNKVDVFINVSESEGVPVSIMEAMSCHIPIVAPNIGGIGEMVEDKESGILLSNKCEVKELIDALKNIQFFKSEAVREKSYNIFLEKYNAKKNYKNFIEDLKSLVK
ncbi:MAG: glycosyltransferase [Spirochaetota bacterium]|nr:glycosyltransferase [Spirochaetota bacterium]